MSNDYWLGVATPAVVLVLLAVTAVALRGLIRLGAAIGGNALRFGNDLPRHKRVYLASSVFSARRGLILGAGNVGIIVIVGQDHERHNEAASALARKIELNPEFLARMKGRDHQ